MSSLPPSRAHDVPPAPDVPRAHDVPPAPDVPPWRVWTAPAAIVFGFALASLATVSVDLAGSAAGSSLSHPPPAVNIVGDIVFDLGFVVAALYLVSLRERPRPADFGYRPVRPRVAVTAFVLAAIAYYGLTAIYGTVFRLHGSDKLPSELGVTHSTAALAAASAFVCVIAPIAEEFFFRGFFFGTLRRWRIEVAGHDLGVWIAAVVTGILFGLAHTGSASSQYLIPLGFLGFVLCIVRWRTGSLYPCMALHSANNVLALGVNQLGWNPAQIVALLLASWLVIAAITAPLGSRASSLA